MTNAYWEVTNDKGEVCAMCDHPLRALELIKNSTVPLGLKVNNELMFDAVNLSFALLREETENALWRVIGDYVDMERAWHRASRP